MKIKGVIANNRRKAFEVRTQKGTYVLPYASLDLPPSQENRICEVWVDPELGNEAFTYTLESGQEDSVHLDGVLEYNRDPAYMRDLLIYQLTLRAREEVRKSNLSKRELIRRLGTSPAQFYRILDQENYRKSIDQVVGLLTALDCHVELNVVPGRSSEGQ